MTDEQRLLEAIEGIHKRLSQLEEAQHNNTAVSRELLHMYENVKGFFAILSWIERLSIWLSKLAIAGGIMWFLFKESVTRAIKSDGGN
jgi:hypothetical protein